MQPPEHRRLLRKWGLEQALDVLEADDREQVVGRCTVGAIDWLAEAWTTSLEMISNRGMPVDFVRFVRDGKDIEGFASQDVAGGRPIRVVDPALCDHLVSTQGCSMTIIGAERLFGAVSSAASDLGTILGGSCDVNLYCTPPGTRGFGAHCDPQDVIIVQMSGRKVWEIWEPVIPNLTMAEYLEGPTEFTGPPSTSAALEHGELLYLPRGWGHAATAEGTTPSVHATIGLQPTTIDQVLVAAGQAAIGGGDGRRGWATAASCRSIIDHPLKNDLEMRADEMIATAASRGIVRVEIA